MAVYGARRGLAWVQRLERIGSEQSGLTGPGGGA